MQLSTVCRGIAAEKILFLCQRDVPEGDSEDYSLLTPTSALFFFLFTCGGAAVAAVRREQQGRCHG